MGETLGHLSQQYTHFHKATFAKLFDEEFVLF